MSTQEIPALPLLEKLRVMELLWADLTQTGSEVESPRWHQQVLEPTGQRIEDGEEDSLDWSEAKGLLRAKRSWN